METECRVDAFEAAEDGKLKASRRIAVRAAFDLLANELDISPGELAEALSERFGDRYYIHRCHALDRLKAIAADPA